MEQITHAVENIVLAECIVSVLLGFTEDAEIG